MEEQERRAEDGDDVVVAGCKDGGIYALEWVGGGTGPKKLAITKCVMFCSHVPSSTWSKPCFTPPEQHRANQPLKNCYSESHTNIHIQTRTHDMPKATALQPHKNKNQLQYGTVL